MNSKLSSKNQMVLPKELRQALGVSGGDELILVPRGNVVVLMKKPASYSDALFGIMKPKKESATAPGRGGKKLSKADKLAKDREKW